MGQYASEAPYEMAPVIEVRRLPAQPVEGGDPVREVGETAVGDDGAGGADVDRHEAVYGGAEAWRGGGLSCPAC
ncbi:hypothetical protein GCM10027160_17580 [Streptomyces calidiresistens]